MHQEKIEIKEETKPHVHGPNCNHEHQSGSTYPTLRPLTRDFPKVGRNEPCPCGSNIKYKKCHGK